MAKMYPERLSARVLEDTRLKGEVEVFNALAGLPDDYEVFYNRAASPRYSAQAYQRFIDFIVLHPVKGLLAIEVKGGLIRYGDDGQLKQYIGRTFGRERWKPTDPYKQVRTALFELIRTCKDDGVTYWIPDNMAVIFPHTGRSELTDTPQSIPSGTLFLEDMGILTVQIPALFPPSRGGRAAFASENFIDMRRRLMSLPEAVRKTSAVKTEAAPRRVWTRRESPANATAPTASGPSRSVPSAVRETKPARVAADRVPWWMPPVLNPVMKEPEDKGQYAVAPKLPPRVSFTRKEAWFLFFITVGFGISAAYFAAQGLLRLFKGAS